MPSKSRAELIADYNLAKQLSDAAVEACRASAEANNDWQIEAQNKQDAARTAKQEAMKLFQAAFGQQDAARQALVDHALAAGILPRERLVSEYAAATEARQLTEARFTEQKHACALLATKHHDEAERRSDEQRELTCAASVAFRRLLTTQLALAEDVIREQREGA